MQVLLVPGFAQTASIWDEIIALATVEAVALEIPVKADFETTALALGDAGGRGLYAGYSMGGRLALYLALAQPDLVEQLILVSSGPGIADPDERLARREADAALADWIEVHSLSEFLDRWAQQPIFAGAPPSGHRRHRLSSPAEIAGQLRRLGQGAQSSLWDRLGELQVPTVFIVGENDANYRDVAAKAAELTGGSASVNTVSGAGHALIHDHGRTLAKAISAAVRANPF